MASRVPRKELNKPQSKPGASRAADDEVVDIGSLPDGDFIKKHIASLSAHQAKLAEMRGKIGAEVKAAENDQNVHRGAAALALKLVRMDAEKREEFLRHFDSYRLQLGFGRQDDLFNDPVPSSGVAPSA